LGRTGVFRWQLDRCMGGMSGVAVVKTSMLGVRHFGAFTGFVEWTGGSQYSAFSRGHDPENRTFLHAR
jgi:hypothetical protein